MVMVISQAAMDLAERKVWVLSFNLIGVPVMRQAIQDHFHDLGLRADKPQLPIGSPFDMRIFRWTRHRLAPGAKLACCLLYHGFTARYRAVSLHRASLP